MKAESSRPTTGRAPRLLLVEDSPDHAVLMRHIFERGDGVEGFSVSHAWTLAEACRELEQGEYDVVLLDLSLPDSDGLDTVDRGIAAAKDTPVVVMTGHDDEELAVQAVRRGAQDYVVKGRVQPGHLPQTVRMALERHRVLLELRRARRRDRRLAFRDPLTRLPNRGLFLERLEEDLRYASRYGHALALLFLDLDDFKPVNDVLGHEAGDQVLVSVADAIRESIRESDAVCRYGGDEFLVALRKIESPEDAALVAEKIRSAIHRTVQVQGERIRPEASIGIALFPEHGPDARALIRHADEAMYHAKRAASPRILFFSPKMKTGEEEGGAEALEQAVVAGEFRVFYQPVVDLGRQRVVGAEALVRWDHPRRGLLLPGEFLPEVEEAGLFPALGEMVLQEALTQARSWHDADGRWLEVAVNACPGHLLDTGFPERVERLLRVTGVPADRLVVEVPERGLPAEEGLAADVLRRLREQGVRVSLDDFGIGASVLAHIRDLPVTGLKLDQSIVQRAPDNERDRAILLTLVTLAGRMGLDLVAEGVETTEQRDLLLEAGCRRMQGFLFGPAVPPSEFRA